MNNFDLATIPASAADEVARIENNASNLILLLPRLSDEQLEAIEEMASATYRASYRLQCATHAEILERIRVRSAMEDGDNETIGKAVSAASQKLGISVSEFYKNAKVHNLFLNAEDEDIRKSAEVLADSTGGAYMLEIASHSKDPTKALNSIAAERLSDPTFTTRKAQELVRQQDGNIAYKPLLSPRTSQLLAQFMVERHRSFPEVTIKTASSPEQGGGESLGYMVRFAIGDLVLCYESAVHAGDLDRVVASALKKILEA